MTGRDEVDRLVEVITVDCDNPSEQMTAFYEVFAKKVPLPTTATVVGATVRVVAGAVEAAVAANCGVAVRAHVEGMHRPNARGIRRVTKHQATTWDIRVLAKTDSDSVQRAASTAALVLQGGRLQELYDVFLLGVRATQTIAPVVGLWAFTAVLEEAGSGRDNVDHVPQVASELRVMARWTRSWRPSWSIEARVSQAVPAGVAIAAASIATCRAWSGSV